MQKVIVKRWPEIEETKAAETLTKILDFSGWTCSWGRPDPEKWTTPIKFHTLWRIISWAGLLEGHQGIEKTQLSASVYWEWHRGYCERLLSLQRGQAATSVWKSTSAWDTYKTLIGKSAVQICFALKGATIIVTECRLFFEVWSHLEMPHECTMLLLSTHFIGCPLNRGF